MTKTRDLSIYEFFKQLQVEYIVAELRRKIYISTKDKNFFTKTMDYKKEKIRDIGFRNCLKSIFESAPTKEECYSKVYLKNSYPDFHYKTMAQRDEFFQKDFNNYYSLGSDVRDSEGEIVGKVKSFDFDSMQLIIKCESGSELMITGEEQVKTIIRIL